MVWFVLFYGKNVPHLWSATRIDRGRTQESKRREKKRLMTNPGSSCIFHIAVVNYEENTSQLITCRCADLQDHYLLEKVLGSSQSSINLAKLYYRNRDRVELEKLKIYL